MRLRTLFFIAACLFIAGGIALRVHPFFQKSITDISIPILSVEPKQIYTISITKNEEELLLTRENNQWIATNGQWSNAVKSDRIQYLLEQIKEVSSVGIAAQAEADWKVLNQVQREVSWVRLYSKTKFQQGFFISKPMPKDTLRGISSYLRLPESAVVYKVNKEIGAAWLQPFDLFRDQQLLAFDPNTVRSFAIQQDRLPEQRFVKVDSIWRDSLGKEMSNTKVQTWLSRLSNLKGQHYADRFNEVEDRQNLIHAVRFHLENQGTISLEVYADSNRMDLPFVIRSDQFSGRYFRSDSIQLNDLMIY